MVKSKSQKGGRREAAMQISGVVQSAKNRVSRSKDNTNEGYFKTRRPMRMLPDNTNTGYWKSASRTILARPGMRAGSMLSNYNY
jgi:hypothetical protein